MINIIYVKNCCAASDLETIYIYIFIRLYLYISGVIGEYKVQKKSIYSNLLSELYTLLLPMILTNVMHLLCILFIYT